MSYKGLPESLVARINPLDARAYAVSSGWHRESGVNGTLALYSHPNSDLDQLIVPLDPNASDYGRRMAEVVANLAERESRPATEILSELLMPPSDVLRFQVAEPESESGSLPLEQAIKLLTGAKKALLSAACSVIQPQSFHPRLSRAEAEGLVEASLIGQTERGSYTVTIACPLAAAGSPRATSATPLFSRFLTTEEDMTDEMKAPVIPPFTRQVTTLLMRSAARITTAVDSDDLASLRQSGPDQPPLSANLCEALLMMQPSGDRSRLTLSATWSRAIPQPEPTTQPSIVHLRHEYFPAIESLSQSLRPVKDPKPTYLIGMVDALLGDPDENGLVRGDVQLLIMNQEELIRARLTLDAPDYHQAWEAHGVGGYVSLNGLLVVSGRSCRIEQVRSFKALKDPAGSSA
jgi:hypothetical protein